MKREHIDELIALHETHKRIKSRIDGVITINDWCIQLDYKRFMELFAEKDFSVERYVDYNIFRAILRGVEFHAVQFLPPKKERS